MNNKYIIGALSLALCFGMVACEDDDDYSVSTTPLGVNIVTGDVSDVTAISSTLSATLSGLEKQAESAYSVGFWYSTSETPEGSNQSIASKTEGGYSANISGLSNNETYYYQAFVTLQQKITYKGEVKSFVSTDSEIATADAANVTSVAASLGGTLSGLTDLMESSALEYGIKLALSEKDVLSGRKYVATGNTNTFSIDVEGLMPNKTYYFVAYMSLNGTEFYGEVKSVQTLNVAINYVDLGLSVQWAETNVGASEATEMGGLYGWGDATGLLTSVDATYGQEADITGSSFDIVLSNNLGGGMLPTIAEYRELINNTTQEFKNIDGVDVCVFTAENGNSITLPMSGIYREGDEVQSADLTNYWSGSIDINTKANALTLALGAQASTSELKRHIGLPVRAVKHTRYVYDNTKMSIWEEGGGTRFTMVNTWNGDVVPGFDPTSFFATEKAYIVLNISNLPNELIGKTGSVYYQATTGAQCWEESKIPVVLENGRQLITLPGSISKLDFLSIQFKEILNLGSAVIYIESLYVDEEPDMDVIYASNGNLIDNSGLLFGDIEGNGNFRMSLYNEYGNQTTSIVDGIVGSMYSSLVAITFTVEGFPAGSYTANWTCDWGKGNWNNANAHGTTITGDGTYTVYATATESIDFFNHVLCIDVKGSINPQGITAKISGVYIK